MKKIVGIVLGFSIAALLVILGLYIPRSEEKPRAVPVAQTPPAPPAPEPCPSETILSKEKLPEGAPVERSWTSVYQPAYEEYVCNGELTIKLSNATTKVFKDKRGAGESTVSYRVLNFYPDLSLLLLHVQHYESYRLQFVSTKDGSEEDLYCEPPFFSPSRRFLLSSCLSLFSEGPRTGFGVWSVADGKVTNVFKKEDEGWGVKDVIWKDDETILFTEVTAVPDTDDRFRERLGMSLIKKESGWQMEPPVSEIPSPARVVSRVGCQGFDVQDDHSHHMRWLGEALKKHAIPVIEQDGYGCDSLFIRNGEILYNYQVLTGVELYEKARTFFQLQELSPRE